MCCRWISMIHYHLHWYIHKRTHSRQGTHSRQVVNIFLDFSLPRWVCKEEFCHLGLVATPFLYSLLFQVCHWAGSDAPVRAVHQRGGPTRRLGPPPIISYSTATTDMVAKRAWLKPDSPGHLSSDVPWGGHDQLSCSLTVSLDLCPSLTIV